MSIVSWNVRGLNGDIALRQTKLLLKYHKADVIFFMETKLAEGKQDYMKKCLGFEEGYEVPRNGMVLNKEEDEDYNIIKYVDSLSFVSIVVFLVGLLNRDNEWCSKVEDMTKIITEFYGHTPDSQLILSIPITLYEHDDDWLWHFTSHGHYSVKSGYNLAIGGENLQPSSSNEVMAAWWSAYWAIKIPKKILHFGWKGFHEILPSFSGLFRRQSLSHRISTPQNVIGFGAVIFSSDKQMKAALSKPLQGIKR
ncbi:hypothetical protein G4B88_027623 [Cannabis sativa]|uniref:Uncharacterized protein n=1 Tax=Cannabis sativa TaxID=3483 RepID=A0A7J6GCH4_CANSA|nr:hypothetical protein G4B88_027623 [Cannabis sativa]